MRASEPTIVRPATILRACLGGAQRGGGEQQARRVIEDLAGQRARLWQTTRTGLLPACSERLGDAQPC